MQQKPNILFITTDQQHWTTLGCRNPEIQTPNLDRLARQGTLFERAYCPNPTCTPTRASLITGLYPSQHGAYSLGTTLSQKVHTVGEDFQGAGYNVSLIGKAHFQGLKGTPEFPSIESYPIMQDLDFWRKFHGPFYGFNHIELLRNHVDEGHAGQHYGIWMEEKGLKNWRDYFLPPGGTRRESPRYKWDLPEEYHYNPWIVERSIARMEQCRRDEKPFFLWASFPDPHPPYLAPEPWDTLYDPEKLTVPELRQGEHEKNPWHFGETQADRPDFSRWENDPGGNNMHGCCAHRRSRERRAKDMAVYYGMTSFTDQAIGKILAWLDASGMRDNTLIVFTSDHGHLFGQHGMTEKGPFHYEDLLRVPMIASWAGRIPEGRRSDALQSLVDYPATFLSCAGIDRPWGMGGCDQREVWEGQAASARERVLVENRHQPNTLNLRSCIDSRYKITVYKNAEYGELFDLERDPDELNNLWDDPAANELKTELLLGLLSETMEAEPLSMPRIAHA